MSSYGGYQNYKFLDQENNNNMSISNPYVQNYSAPINNYKDFFDPNIEQYAQSNSDYFNLQNSINQGFPQNTDYGSNGRVYFDIKKPSVPYKLFQENIKPSSDYNNILNYSQESTPLSQTYFSRENMNLLQQMIKQEVFRRCEIDIDPILTNHKPVHISNQDETSLQVIMRSIYLQYSKNSPVNIDCQVADLNMLVLSECVPDIITNLKQYLGYIADIQRQPNPLDHPAYVSSKGEKTYSLLIV
jgi:hypothetical protein